MSAKNPFELPEERLATTYESGKRRYLYPASVRGFFRSFRSYLYWGLIIIFLGLPWVTFNGQPLILLDIVHRKFIIFGVSFWAHEAPILVLVLLSFVLIMGLITALFGRVWCGFACPQTVFIDAIFRRIEEFLEGSGLSRQRFDMSPMTFKKMGIKTIKWGLFFAASLIITHSFLAYFVGAEKVLEMIQKSPQENIYSFLTIVISLIIILFNFAWFREQFCIIACPYGRLQSVIMDEDSLVVGYDSKRGEPRKKDRHDTDFTGDCVNCYRCVQVCPTGIDIRRGTQMECIMCTACIDACDTVMKKVNKDTGLVRISSEKRLNNEKPSFFRVRVAIYLILLVIVFSALSVVLSQRNMVPIFSKRSTHPPYVVLTQTLLQNQFNLTIRNQHFSPVQLSFTLSQEDIDKGASLIQPMNTVDIPSGKKKTHSIFIRFPKTYLNNGSQSLFLIKTIEYESTMYQETEEVRLIGPR